MALRLRTPTDIGNLIRARRHALGLDQAELARRVGVSRLWINQIERGKPGAGLGLVLRTLGTLDVELAAGARDVAGTEAEPRYEPVITPDVNAIIANARRREGS